MTEDIKNITLSIYRFNPEQDSKPYMKDYTLAVSTKVDIMLLTLIERIKAEQDSSLTFRRSCREGVCGSDGMNINGKNGLACVTSFFDLKTDKVVLRPLPGFPIIRDLVVDMAQFYAQYEKIEPYLTNLLNKTKLEVVYNSIDFQDKKDDKMATCGAFVVFRVLTMLELKANLEQNNALLKKLKKDSNGKSYDDIVVEYINYR
jgi:succinate dehydrogenase/fumarate reductase iron-sulfur protein